jgi:hypothetical protein
MGRTLAAYLVVLAASCAAPTLPLPPPETSVGPPNVEGIVEVQGSGAQARALCICVNTSTDGVEGVYAEGDGTFTIRIAASVNDELECWYQDGFDVSQISYNTVPPAE